MADKSSNTVLVCEAVCMKLLEFKFEYSSASALRPHWNSAFLDQKFSFSKMVSKVDITLVF